MAFIVGTMLLILVFVGVPLQYAANTPQVAEVVGPIHGFLYIVYLITALDLTRRARLNLLWLLGMVGAGFLPFLAFFVEHWINKRLRAQLDAGGGLGAGEAAQPEGAGPAAGSST